MFPQASVIMQRLSYPTETVLTNKITRNRIVLSFKDSLRKPLRRRPLIYLEFTWEHLTIFHSWIKLSIPPLNSEVHIHFGILLVPGAFVVVVIVLIVLVIIVIVVIDSFLIGFP